jgi:hypothetical protein
MFSRQDTLIGAEAIRVSDTGVKEAWLKQALPATMIEKKAKRAQVCSATVAM